MALGFFSLEVSWMWTHNSFTSVNCIMIFFKCLKKKKKKIHPKYGHFCWHEKLKMFTERELPDSFTILHSWIHSSDVCPSRKKCLVNLFFYLFFYFVGRKWWQVSALEEWRKIKEKYDGQSLYIHSINSFFFFLNCYSPCTSSCAWKCIIQIQTTWLFLPVP